jgi:hypothetical protein
LVRERYEELLWWLLMPALLRLAGEPALDRAALGEMGKFVDEALATAEAAGYRIDALLEPAEDAGAREMPEPEATGPVEHGQAKTMAPKPEASEIQSAEAAAGKRGKPS